MISAGARPYVARSKCEAFNIGRKCEEISAGLFIPNNQPFSIKLCLSCANSWNGRFARRFDMPHYADGTEAKIGDMVRGTGYNIKHEVVGKVVRVIPGESCTLTVACISADSPMYVPVDSSGAPLQNMPLKAEAIWEYGDTVCFSKITCETQAR